MKIAAYARVSTEKESQVESFEKQIEFFNEFTKKNRYELYKIYADEGIFEVDSNIRVCPFWQKLRIDKRKNV